LSLGFGPKFIFKPLLELLIGRHHFLLSLTELLQFAFHLLLPLVPLLTGNRRALFLVLQRALKLKYLLRKFLHFLTQLAYFSLVLSLLLDVVRILFYFLFFELLNELSFLLILLLGLLREVLDLLQVKGLLLVVLGFALPLHACDFLLLFEGLVHPLGHLALLSRQVFPHTV
jgi:hypothetical protein